MKAHLNGLLPRKSIGFRGEVVVPGLGSCVTVVVVVLIVGAPPKGFQCNKSQMDHACCTASENVCNRTACVERMATTTSPVTRIAIVRDQRRGLKLMSRAL